MSERIRELAEQATSSRIEYDPKTMMTERIQEFDKEKFAELIVQECLEVINKEHDEGIDRHGDYQLALYEAYREIKEHFEAKLKEKNT
jgi:hypothetical protein